MISKLSFGFNKKNIQLKNVVNNSVSSSHQSCATHKIWIKASRRVIGNPQPSVPWSGTIARKEGNFESFLPARNNFPVVTFQVTESYQIQIFPLVSCDTWLFPSLFPPLNATSGKYQEKSIIIDYIKQLRGLRYWKLQTNTWASRSWLKKGTSLPHTVVHLKSDGISGQNDQFEK